MDNANFARQDSGPARVFQISMLAAAAFLMLAGMSAMPGMAQGRPGPGGPHGHWEGDIHRFHEHDWDRWRGGRWYHGRHSGRDGWWWIVGGLWYFYPQPVYPYPNPYVPPVVVAPTAPPPPPANYYYCDNPAGYYPYVPTCRVPWRLVPAG
jgi:hypothetical protein